MKLHLFSMACDLAVGLSELDGIVTSYGERPARPVLEAA
jgi:hypothetical protein